MWSMYANFCFNEKLFQLAIMVAYNYINLKMEANIIFMV